MAGRAIAAAAVESRNIRPEVFNAVRRIPALFLAYSTLRKTLRTQHALMNGHPATVVVVTGSAEVTDAHRKAAELLLMGSTDTWNRRSHRRELVHVLDLPSHRKKSKIANPILEEHGKYDFIIVLARSRAEVPPDLAISADAIVDLARPKVRHIHAVRRLLGRQPFDEETATIVATLDFPLLVPVVCKRRLSAAEAQHLIATAQGAAASAPSLEELPGYGKAKDWANTFIADLGRVRIGELAWVDMDRGVLLYGPPGTGKTLFARAFAQSAGLPLISASVSRWQSYGHLGDLLGAMRETFDRARAQQPAIIFLDELDSIGDRTKFSGDHVNYSRQVVNYLLECIDGAEGRDQVVVVAATNLPEVIDPALLRSGRIERHIKVDLPGANERFDILRYHLAIKSSDEALRIAAADLEGWNGADLEMLAREAKQRSRLSQRAVQVDDVIASLPPLQELSSSSARRVTVHEAGHAVVACILSPGCRVTLSFKRKFRWFRENELAPGMMRYELSGDDQLLQTREDFEDLICRTLAGAAAEEHILGSRSNGFSGSIGSDLETATVIATRMLCSYGLGGSLPFLIESRRVDATRTSGLPGDLRREVGRILDEQYSRAMAIVAEHTTRIEEMAAELMNRGMLGPDDVATIFANGVNTGGSNNLPNLR
ncbi:AAA family ATPase [Rhizobium leguminosarum bv. viciae]|nr:AAA family ATPase [Rhizobium leguminosarum bv. viciae]